MDYNDILNIVSLFRVIDYTFVLTLFTFLIACAAFYFAVISFRPKLHLEIKSVLAKDLLSSYDLVLSNNGNVLAENIKICYDDSSLKKALNSECFYKDLSESEFGSFNFIKKTLSKEIKYLGSGCDRKGTFVYVEKRDDEKITCPLLFNTPFNVEVTYINSITRIKYKETITLELLSHSSLTNHFMVDELGHDLETIQKTLKEIKTYLQPVYIKTSVSNGLMSFDKLQNAKKVFISFNKKEKAEIINILLSCYSDFTKQIDPYLFDKKIKKYLNKTNALSRKLKKLHHDNFNNFFNVVLRYNERTTRNV